MSIEDQSAPKVRRRKQARPGEIIEAGMGEFVEHGFERARLDRIAKAAGIAKGTIYLYFESKEVLFEEVVKTHVLSVMEAADADISDVEGTTEMLVQKLLSRIYEHMTTQNTQTIIRILLTEGDRFPELVQRYHDVAISKGTHVLERFLSRGIARGEIEPGPMTKVPELLIAPIMFYVVNQIVFSAHKTLDRDAFFAGHVDMVLRALKMKR